MTTPAGWYPDSGQPGQLRYWDGQAWTDHLIPMPPPPSASPPEPVTPPPPEEDSEELPAWMRRNLAERPAWMIDGVQLHLLEASGVDDISVVGESFYQEALWYVVRDEFAHGERVKFDCRAVLEAQEGNPSDPNATAVWVNGLKVGYLSRQDAADFRPSLLSLRARLGKEVGLRASINGGGMREDGVGNLGIWLYYDPEELRRS